MATDLEGLPTYRPGRAGFGFLVPPEIPPAIAAKLNGEIVRILNSPEAEQVLGESGLEVIPNTPAEFAVMIREDAKIWDDAAVAAGLIATP